MSASDLIGWERLRHGGLLLDPARTRKFADEVRPPVGWHNERELRQQLASLPEKSSDIGAFARFVLEELCGFTNGNGRWVRGSDVDPSLGRRGLGGELIKPRWIWKGADEGLLPVFFDNEARVGVGRGRKVASQVVQWLRAGTERLALLTNGKQWRLVFAALDADAWCEWDADLWLEEGQLSPQVACLRILLSPRLWTPTIKGAHPPLVQAVIDSRKGQAELSAALGERVREAVEILVQAHGEPLKRDCAAFEHSLIYRAAVRIVMRMVVVLFAESRDLLKLGNPLYYRSYGLGSLLADLEKAAARGASRLGRSHNAWPRVLALFRLVYEGSHHPELPVPAYGGELFSPGGSDSLDGLQKSIGVFETACFDQEIVSDRDVLQMLERLTRTRIKIRQGNTTTTVSAPVDFSDLSSEYIGILYEGLLDFELKTAPADDPVIFLGIGNQPALPLSRLDGMDDKALASLLEKMKDTSSASSDSEDDEEEDETEEASEGSDDGEAGDVDDAAANATTDAGPADPRQVTRTRAEVWARRAVAAGKLVSKPRGALTAAKTAHYEEQVGAKARQLVTRVVLGGEWYLVRWGGTRKGSGTFYTRPGLAVPTVHRTLRPLAYNPPTGDDGKPNVDAPAAEWTPRTPEEILSITVCDPACGSGTFPVAALRFLTDALHAAHHHHGQEKTTDADEPRFRALLRRQVVERCIYGVDFDPLAVELCRLALWIETMDRTLPFSFLDHKIKTGNSLTGAWFDTYQHYPAMAWKKREALKGGPAIRAFVADQLAPDLRDLLSGRTAMFEGPSDDPLTIHAEAMAGLERIHALPEHESAERARLYNELRSSHAYLTLKEAMDLWCACWFWPLDAIAHAPLPTTIGDPSEEIAAVLETVVARKQFFHWELEFPDVFGPTRSGFDAILGNPPWDVAKPNSKEFFSNIDPLYRSYGKQEALAYQKTYFEGAGVERNWELYNDDFKAQSNFVGYAASPFGDPTVEDWESYSIAKGNKNLDLHAEWRHRRTSSRGYADKSHAFRHQGSADVNLYKLFLEQAHALLREGGRLGFIVPSGVYSDHGTRDLRTLFLDSCAWEWLFGFENRDKIFDIHRSFKFNPMIVVKGGRTEAIRTAFMRRKLEDWEHGEDFVTPYSRAQVDQFSPRSKAILEIQSARDLEILEKIYKNSVLLGDDGPDGWGITYSREFDMTNDSKLFPPRPVWEAQGYRPDEYSRWLKGHWRPIAELWPELKIDPANVVPIDADCERRMSGSDVKRTPWRVRCAQPPYDSLPIPRADIPAGIVLSREADAWIRKEEIEDVALPLYEGRMIGQFDFSEKGWVSGKGRTATWREIPWALKQIEPQYLIARRQSLSSDGGSTGPKIAYMRISSSTNSRTTISTFLRDCPAGDSVFFFLPRNQSLETALVISGVFSSLSFDTVIRQKLGGLNMSEFVMLDAPLPKPSPSLLTPMSRFLLALNVPSALYAREWMTLSRNALAAMPWKSVWALTPRKRLEMTSAFEAVVALWFGLGSDEFRQIVAECDLPVGAETAGLNAKGFWRISRGLPPQIRSTVLALVALQQLQRAVAAQSGSFESGVNEHLSLSDMGWAIPETARLADYGLRADGATDQGQPVASLLGESYLDWQWAQSAEESWLECETHASNLASS